MKLTEIKTAYSHYFEDEQGRWQGEYKLWYDNGQQWSICHYKDGEFHGEFKCWDSNGELCYHTFEIDGNKIIIDFIKNPELYPTTPEEKTMFALKYGSGPFIGDTNETY